MRVGEHIGLRADGLEIGRLRAERVPWIEAGGGAWFLEPPSTNGRPD